MKDERGKHIFGMVKVGERGQIVKTTLPNGVLLNYGEGPDNGPALFLINGQAMQWEDYARDLPELSKLTATRTRRR